MDTTRLRAAYDRFLDAATRPDLEAARDGGWDADEILAHVLSVDAGVAAAALGVVSGLRPSFDNRVSLDAWNLGRIIGEHAGRTELVEHLRGHSGVLCDIAEQLSVPSLSVLVPTLLVSHDAAVVDQPVTLGALIDGLAADHLPRHTLQLIQLRGSQPVAAASGHTPRATARSSAGSRG